MLGRYLAIVGLLAASSLSFGQEFRANISGHITDQSSGAVARATITAVNAENQESSSATSSSTGSYTIPLLRPGVYRVSVSSPNFKEFIRESLTLQVGQSAGLDVVLEVGAVTERVEVTGEVELLDTQSASGGGVVDTLQVAELPLNARNPFMLGAIMAGVGFTGSSIWQRPFDNGAIAGWIINGGWNSNNEFLLDGAPNNAQMGSNNIAYVPIVDAVQEFSIQQNTYDAQYGKTSGGIMNAILKSGGSQFHGTGYEFLRRTPLDANTFQNNAIGAKKTEHYLDQYGGQVTGPIYLPWLLKKESKVKLFYLGSFENYREGTPNPLVRSFPELDMRNGDFSKLTNAAGQKITIYDPTSAAYNANGDIVSARVPFANNQIPASRINPTAAAVFSYMPKPNITTPGVGYGTNNLSLPNYFDKDRFYNLILKFDWNFGDKHRAFFRHASNDRTEERNDNGVEGPGMDGQQPFQRINDAYVLDWVSTINASTVLNVRLSNNRFIEKGYGRGNENFDLSKLGLPTSLIGQLPQPTYFGRWEFDGYTSMGRYRGVNITNNYGIEGSVTKIWRSHTIHTGIDVRQNQFLLGDTGNILYTHSNGAFTQNVWNQGNGVSGNSWASFLLGYADTGSSNYPAYPFFKQWYIAPFVQDDWKVTRKLTLNLGLRYDINTPPTEKYNRLNGPFDANVTSPIASQISPANLALYPQLASLKGAMTFAGTNGVSNAASDIRWGNFQPRVGFAYALSPRWVIRGGYGRYFMNPSNDYLQYNGFSNGTNMVTSIDGGRTPIPNMISNPYPRGINTPPGSSLGALSYVGNGFNWFDHSFKLPDSNQFSLGFQYAVSHASTLDVKYVGNRIRNLQTNAGNDEPNLAARKTCFLAEGGSAAYCDAQVTNPFYNLPAFSGTGLGTSPTTSRWQMMRPYPQYGWLTQQGRNDGFVHYNALQMSYNYRARGGLTLLANYTFAKQVESWGFNDLQAGKLQSGLYTYDRPHVIKITPVYQLPFGEGKHFGATTHGVVKKLISGWEATASYAYQSGIPADLPGNVQQLRNPSVKTNFNSYQPRGWSPCVLQQLNDGTIQPMSYSLQDGCGTDQSKYAWMILPGYAPRETPYRSGQIRMWGTFTMDASLNKTTKITERVSAQFRAEAFNVMNHFWDGYDKFNTNPFDPNFGTIQPGTSWTGNGVYPRQIQLGFKVLW